MPKMQEHFSAKRESIFSQPTTMGGFFSRATAMDGGSAEMAGAFFGPVERAETCAAKSRGKGELFEAQG
ncbi:MAG TPA: hypothetical protein VFL54_06640 [Gammaproteobacteria bacterium]|nr:hypothetical protein [Gammaproteobacteria bacterium]